MQPRRADCQRGGLSIHLVHRTAHYGILTPEMLTLININIDPRGELAAQLNRRKRPSDQYPPDAGRHPCITRCHSLDESSNRDEPANWPIPKI